MSVQTVSQDFDDNGGLRGMEYVSVATPFAPQHNILYPERVHGIEHKGAT